MEPPQFPKLRALEPRWVDHNGRPFLLLRDPLALSDHTVLIPQPLVPLLALMDGTRDVAAMRTAMALRTGFALPTGVIEDLVVQLDRALLLENGLYQWERARALREFREAPHRPHSHVGLVYPEDAGALADLLGGFCRQVGAEAVVQAPPGTLVGMVSPHIDYRRGWPTYARLWKAAEPHLEGLELAVVLGTDHAGGPGTLTLTRQSYATPLGVLPTDVALVDELARAIGEDRAFDEELHHRREHSIELASVWLHYFLGGAELPLLPVLCGSFHHYIEAGRSPREDPVLEAAVDYLRRVIRERRTLVIAAGDLAHVGPAFGDSEPLDPVARARLKAEDERSLEAIAVGDAEAFFRQAAEEGDRRRLCGLPPIYLLLRVTEGARGPTLGYLQCPADEGGGSLVSIAGALLFDRA